MIGRLPAADPGRAAPHRRGPDLPDRAGRRRRAPPPRPLPPPLQGHVPRPPHGRRRPQAALPPAAARGLPAATRQLLTYFRLSVSKKIGSRSAELGDRRPAAAETGWMAAAETRVPDTTKALAEWEACMDGAAAGHG